MSTTELREEVHRYIDQADDRVLRLVKGLLQADLDYTIPGEPMTQNQLEDRVKAAKSRIESGRFTTQEDLEREMEEW